MSEHPIIFSGDSVRSILTGRKSQTRRVILGSPPPTLVHREPSINRFWSEPGGWIRCRYGFPGDRLWVREAWRVSEDAPITIPHTPTSVHFRADPDEMSGGPWRPSIHMPGWASRLTLEITGVRVQRLQEIGEADCLAEGVEREDLPPDPDSFHPPGSYGFVVPGGRGKATIHVRPQEAFASAWDAINRQRAPWDSNPWVWCLTFKRIGGGD